MVLHLTSVPISSSLTRLHLHVQELYKAIEKMRPNLFRMATELKQNEEGMSDILQTNDSILRVTDLYNSKMKQSPSSQATPTTSNGVGAVAGACAESSSSASATGAATAMDDLVTGTALIDLADWNFDPTPITGAVGGEVQGDINSSIGLGSFLDDLSALGKGTLSLYVH